MKALTGDKFDHIAYNIPEDRDHIVLFPGDTVQVGAAVGVISELCSKNAVFVFGLNSWVPLSEFSLGNAVACNV